MACNDFQLILPGDQQPRRIKLKVSAEVPFLGRASQSQAEQPTVGVGPLFGIPSPTYPSRHTTTKPATRAAGVPIRIADKRINIAFPS